MGERLLRKLRDELLNREISYTLKEARIVSETDVVTTTRSAHTHCQSIDLQQRERHVTRRSSYETSVICSRYRSQANL